MAESSKEQSKGNPFSRKEEREMREALRQTYATEFPNPKRDGCPDKPKLRALARREMFSEAQGVAAHISHCSPCSQELTELTRQHKSRQWVYRLAAVGLMVVGISTWALMRHRGTNVPPPPPIAKTPSEPASPLRTQEPSAQEPKPPEFQVVVLDLRKRGISRGENSNQDGDLALPKGRLKLSILLPIGSEKGDYEVRISGRRDHVVMAKGRAAMTKHINALTVEMDTASLQAGRHSLAIRQAGWGWYRYPIQLQ
ncbi:MAG: hypothetical protein ACRD2L_00760 [Terriglobia bacterium]